MARSPTARIRTAILFLLSWFIVSPASAQLAPEIGYVFPPGAQAGTTVDVVIGGYDWTPDMQIFVHDQRVKLEITGPPSEVLAPDPPYWFGAKARGHAWPLPREFPARLTVPADVPPGLVKFQVANANGASPPGLIQIGDAHETVEAEEGAKPQMLPALPVTVSGQVRRIEEIDRYEFTPTADGPVRLELTARKFGSMLHGQLRVEDADGGVVLDRADTAGRDLAVSFIGKAGQRYIASLNDLDYAGDRSYVYRLAIAQGPLVEAGYPSAGRPGETREVEFVGQGIATGANRLESFRAMVAFPGRQDVSSFEYLVQSPSGASQRFVMGLSAVPQTVKPDGAMLQLPSLPAAVTGAFGSRFASDWYEVNLRKDEKWQLSAEACSANFPVDLHLSVLGPDGKDVAENDDAPGTTDARLELTAATDGKYTVVVTDQSGFGGTAFVSYRLSIDTPKREFSLSIPSQIGVLIGSAAKLPLKLVRTGGFSGCVHLSLWGLPEGITAPAEVNIEEGKSELEVELKCAADAETTAQLATLTATAQIGGEAVTQSATVLIATTMKPRIKLTPEGLDDVRKVHRGSTFLAPVLIERLEGFAGEVRLEMTAKQQRHRQGLASADFLAPAGATRVEYPIFVPEWLETTKTSRMILNGAVQVADPKGNVRMLLQRQDMRIGILPEGALMKLGLGDANVQREGSEIKVPLTLVRAPHFRLPAKVELLTTKSLSQLVTASPIEIAADASCGTMLLKLACDPAKLDDQSLSFRATSLVDGKWPVVSEVQAPMAN